jgi:hypothetical protein
LAEIFTALASASACIMDDDILSNGGLGFQAGFPDLYLETKL